MSPASTTFKTVVSSALLLSLAACSSGSGGGGGGTTPKVNPGDVVSADTAGKFEIQKVGELGEFGLPPKEFEIVREQCKGISMQEKSKNGFDKNLKVGQKFREMILNATSDSVFGMTQDLTLKSKSGNNGVFSVEITKVNTAPAPNKTIPEVLRGTSTCTLDETSGTSGCEMDYTDGFIPPTSPKYTYCSGRTIDFSAMKGTVALGTFTMASGKTVSARRIEKTNKVKIVCFSEDGNEKEMGEGTEISVSIESVDVVHHRYLSCYQDGTPIYNYSTLILGDGTTMTSSKSEILEAPLAK